MLNIKNEVLVRAYLVALGLVAVTFAIFLRMFQISVRDAAKWEAKADSLYVKWVDAPSQRGNILADDGSLLATSLPFFDIHFDPKAEGLTDRIFNNQAVDSLGWLLSTYVDGHKSPGAYASWLKELRTPDSKARYVLIARELPYAKAMQIKKFPIFREGRKAGFILEQTNRRERPFRMLAQRTIGYTREHALPVGLEGAFNGVLEGREGKQLVIKVSGDVYLPVSDLAEIEPEAGDDIVTTLDINIQDVAENSLLRACQTHNADHGCAIVMEVKTGKIRAIANIGKTDEGWWETYNYAVGQKMEPGSVFKLVSFMAMMEAGKLPALDAAVPVYRGKRSFYGVELEDAHKHGLDYMTVKQVFAQSSNVGTATLIEQAFGANPSAFYDQLVKFGLDKTTEIEIGGEDQPVIKNPRNSAWSGTTLPWMSIGYELSVTPLQMLTFYNAVANNGRMMKPWLVQRTERYGETIKEFQPKVVSRSIASETTIRNAHKLLKDVVLSGTASGIRSEHFSMAGKTGTTQVGYHRQDTGNGLEYQASFCGFFPADNPVYSCIVVIGEPQTGGYHGAEVAAPVFKAIAERCYSMKAELQTPVNSGGRKILQATMMPHGDAGTVNELKRALDWLGLNYKYTGDNTGDWSVLMAANDSSRLEKRSISNNSVPSVVGMGLKDALYLLENRKCRVKVVGVGKVRRQVPEPGTVARGTTCVLYLE